jgi:alcohol dehydrogenase class IV
MPMGELRAFDMPRVRRVIQGAGARHELAAELDAAGHGRVIVLTGKTLGASAALEELRAALGDRLVDVYTGVEAHNPVERVVEMIARTREVGAEAIVALGGGSPSDAAKLTALGVVEGVETTADLAEFAVRFEYPATTVIRPLTRTPLPVFAIPTTLSAAEWDGFAGSADHSRDTKDLTAYLEITPEVVLLDPELAAETPRGLWAETGVRALDHAVETAYAKNAHPYTTWLAAGALDLLAANLPRSVADPSDHEAALNCQIAGWMSIIGVHNVSLGLSHAIGHQLGALGIPHGATSCIMLPHVMRFLEPATSAQQAAMATVLARAQGADEVGAAADHVEVLFGELGVPRRVSDFEIPREKMDSLAKSTLGDMVVREAPRTVDEGVVYELLEKAW